MREAIAIMRPFILFLIFSCLTAGGAFSQCTEDCVWPGDLNNNGIVNNLDALAIGFTINQTGPARTDQSTTWAPLNATDWAGSLPSSGTNFKHIDADGNGTIDDIDRFPISINYLQTNEQFTTLLGNNIEGNDLFAVPVNTTTTPGSSYILDIHLGSEAAPIEDIYGIGFRLEMDTQYVADVTVNYTESWLGMDEEIFAYDKFDMDIDHLGMAITRVDGSPVSGFGKIAQVEIVITDVILGLEMDSTLCLPFLIDFSYVLGIDEMGNDLMITAHGDSLNLKHPSQITSNSSALVNEFDLKIYPNPANDFFVIEYPESVFTQLILYNSFGQQVVNQSIQNMPFQLAVADLPRGIYFLELGGDHSRSTRKILLE